MCLACASVRHRGCDLEERRSSLTLACECGAGASLSNGRKCACCTVEDKLGLRGLDPSVESDDGRYSESE